MAIIALLLSLLAAALGKARAGARSVACLSNVRTVSLDFGLFADSSTGEDRGRSDACPPSQFYFEDFADKEYRVDEFWTAPSRNVERMNASQERMMCPAGPGELYRVPDRPCNDGAVEPFENVSLAFNRRLFAETILFKQLKVFNPDTKVFTRILDHPYVPIVFDADGELAQSLSRRPYFSAPPIAGHDDLYADGNWWFPSKRHLERMNIGFVDGHAAAVKDPLADHTWEWTYQPTPFP